MIASQIEDHAFFEASQGQRGGADGHQADQARPSRTAHGEGSWPSSSGWRISSRSTANGFRFDQPRQMQPASLSSSISGG